MKRKTLALLLVLALVFGLASCDSGENAASGDPASNPPTSEGVNGENSNEPGNETDRLLIGYNQLLTGDYALDTLANNIKFAIESAGHEAMGVVAGGNVDQMITDIENMIAAGCDGLVLWLPIEAQYLTVAEMCEAAGVYWTLADKLPSDEILEQLKDYEYFAGGIAPDSYSYGVRLAEYAIEQGYQSAYIQASGIGDASGTPRIEGFRDTFEAAGGTILDEAHTDDTNEAVTQAENLYLTYGDQADCIMCTGASTFGTAALTILQKYDEHDVKILTADLDQTILQSMAEDDYVAVCTGDYWVCGSLSAVMCINALENGMWTDENGDAAVISNVPAFSVPSEQLELFNTYIAGNALFSDAEIRDMVDGDLDNFRTWVENFDLVSRFESKYADGLIPAEAMEAAGLSVN